MAWVRRRANKTYYSVGWTAHSPEARVFWDIPLPGGGAMRVLNKGVHQAALERAGEKLRELDRRSGKSEPRA
jgi:hypothetical protein